MSDRMGGATGKELGKFWTKTNAPSPSGGGDHADYVDHVLPAPKSPPDSLWDNCPED